MFLHSNFHERAPRWANLELHLRELVEKGAKDDIVRELLAQIFARLIDFEIQQRMGAEYGEGAYNANGRYR